MKNDLIILAGGRGLRLKKYTKTIPKPLLKVNKISMIENILNQFSRYDFNKIYILTGYKGNLIKKKIHKKIFNFNEITCLKEKKLLGTGGGIKKNLHLFSDKFFVINADSYCDFEFNKFQSINLRSNLGIILLVKNSNYKSNKKLSNLSVYKKKIFFKKKSNYMNGGVYFLKKKCFQAKNFNEKISLEEQIIAPLIKKNQILGFKSNNFFIDIGTEKNYKKSKNLISKNLRRPAVFIDRDGTINEDVGYLHKIKNLKFKSNILKTLNYLSKKKIYLFIVTNQAGIGKKIFTLKQFNKFHKKLKEIFIKKKIFIDEVIYSPYHPKAKIKKYKKKSLYRKPGNLMIENLMKRWEVLRNKSIFIGDQTSDETAAKKSNIEFFYYKKNIFNKIKEKFNNYS